MKKMFVSSLGFALISLIACEKEQSAVNLPSGSDTTKVGSSGSVTSVLKPLTNDSVFITPTLVDSGSTRILKLQLTTQKSYDRANNYLASSLSRVDSAYSLALLGVGVPKDSLTGQARATGTISFDSVKTGIHPFKVVINGSTYTGSFIKDGSTYTFTWPYNKEVFLSPLKVQ